MISGKGVRHFSITGPLVTDTVIWNVFKNTAYGTVGRIWRVKLYLQQVDVLATI